VSLERLGIGLGVVLILLIPVALNVVGLKITAIGCSLLVAYGLVVVVYSLRRRSEGREAEVLELVGVTCVMGGSLIQVAALADAFDRTGLLALPVVVWPLLAVIYANVRRRLLRDDLESQHD